MIVSEYWMIYALREPRFAGVHCMHVVVAQGTLRTRNVVRRHLLTVCASLTMMYP